MTQNKDNLPFAQRYGFEPTEIPFQVDSMNDGLRVDLWNSFYLFIYSSLEKTQYGHDTFRRIYKQAWLHFFRKPFDDFPGKDYLLSELVRDHIEKASWYKVYEFFEFIFKNIQQGEEYSVNDFISYVDNILKLNHSAYRIVNNKFIPITNDTEVNEIKAVREAAKTFGLSGIQEHLNSSLDLISKKPKPDLRNSIKESISMVEVICRIIEPNENTLGKALNKIENKGTINRKNGIRHALMDDENLGLEDAKFFLVSCSAFTNYLIEKANKENLLTLK
jgi:hypothetical protein